MRRGIATVLMGMLIWAGMMAAQQDARAQGAQSRSGVSMVARGVSKVAARLGKAPRGGMGLLKTARPKSQVSTSAPTTQQNPGIEKWEIAAVAAGTAALVLAVWAEMRKEGRSGPED
jgi:hypothetical protein